MARTTIPGLELDQTAIDGLDLFLMDIQSISEYADHESGQRLDAVVETWGVCHDFSGDDTQLLPSAGAPFTISITAGYGYAPNKGEVRLDTMATVAVTTGDAGKWIRIRNLLEDDLTSARTHPVSGTIFYVRQDLDTEPTNIIELTTTAALYVEDSAWIYLGKITAVTDAGAITIDLTVPTNRHALTVIPENYVTFLERMVTNMSTEERQAWITGIAMRYTAVTALLDTKTFPDGLVALTVDPTPEDPINVSVTTGFQSAMGGELEELSLGLPFRGTLEQAYVLVSWGLTGTDGVGGLNTFDTKVATTLNFYANQTLIDSANNRYTVTGNDANGVLTVSGTPASGAFIVSPDSDQYIIVFAPKNNSEQGVQNPTLTAFLFTQGNESGGGAGLGVPTPCSAVIRNLTPGVTYEFKVRAVNGRYGSAWSTGVTIEAGYAGITIPAMGPTATVTRTFFGADISWSAAVSGDAYGYYFIYTLDGTEPDETSTDNTFWVDAHDRLVWNVDAESGTLIRVKVYAYDVFGRKLLNYAYGSGIAGRLPIEIPINVAATTGVEENYLTTESALDIALPFRKVVQDRAWILVTWDVEGDDGVGGVNTFDTGVPMVADLMVGRTLIDGMNNRFTVTSSDTLGVLTVDGTPLSGKFTVSPDGETYEVLVEPVGDASGFGEEYTTVCPVSGGGRGYGLPTPTSRRISGLRIGARYVIRVRAKRGIDYSDWSDAVYINAGWGNTAAPRMSSVILITKAIYGVDVSWGAASGDVSGYYITYTIDESTPNEDDVNVKFIDVKNRLKWSIEAPPGVLVRVRVYAYDKYGRRSSNYAEGSAFAGGSIIKQNDKPLNPPNIDFDDTDNSESARKLYSTTLSTQLHVFKVSGEITTLSDGPQKIRVYEEGNKAGAWSFTILETGKVSYEVGDTTLDISSEIVVDLWDDAWDTTPPGTYPTIKGWLTVWYYEDDVAKLSRGNVIRTTE